MKEKRSKVRIDDITVIAFRDSIYTATQPMILDADYLMSRLNAAMDGIHEKHRQRAIIEFGFLYSEGAIEDAHGAEPCVAGLSITISYQRQETMIEHLARCRPNIASETYAADLERKRAVLEHRLSETVKLILIHEHAKKNED